MVIKMEIVKNEVKNAEYEKRARSLVAQMTLEEKAFQMLNGAPAIERLGIKASRRCACRYGYGISAGHFSGCIF